MKKKLFSLLILFILLSIGLLPNISSADNHELNISRISGSDRYETAVKVSQEEFETSKYLILASGEEFSDALIGGTLSTQIEAPILLVEQDSIPNNVQAEIKRLNPEEVFLLGGTSTISESVENNIKKLISNTHRIAGKNRFETAEEIRKTRIKLGGFDKLPETFFYYDSYADALASIPFINKSNTALIPVYNSDTVYDNKNGPVYIIGGYDNFARVFSEGIENGTFRIYGKDRYETAFEISDSFQMFQDYALDTIVLVDGTNYPDALTSSVLASKNNGTILLTEPNKLPDITKKRIDYDNIKNIIIVGGENSVSTDIEKELNNYIDPNLTGFDRLPKGLQAYLMMNITGDSIIKENRDLPYNDLPNKELSFSYDYDGNTAYARLFDSSKVGEFSYKFTINSNTVTFIDAVFLDFPDNSKPVYITKKTVTKKELYDEYLAHKDDYDKAVTNIWFRSSRYVIKQHEYVHKN